MIYYKTDTQVELIRKSCLLVSKTLGLVGQMLKPGVTGYEIDKAAETFIRDHKAKPGFKGYRGFPSTLCISINEQVVHGIPSKKREFKDGDVVSVDCGVFWNGFYGDAAYTFPIGDVNEKTMELLRVTNQSLYKAIDKAVVGRRLGDIGHAVQQHVKKYKFTVVKELVGHGLGRQLHEEPEVANYGKRGRGLKLKDGLVLAIEPMINLGVADIKHWDDGWTVTTKDNKPSAHYEHTVVVRRKKADILSSHRYVEQAIKKNPELKEVSIKKQIFAD